VRHRLPGGRRPNTVRTTRSIPRAMSRSVRQPDPPLDGVVG
jgi:hypothetical protein